MNQQSIRDFVQPESSPPLEDYSTSLRQKNSLHFKRWQIVSASLLLLLAGVGIGKFEAKTSAKQTQVIQTPVKPLSVKTSPIQLVNSYQTLQSYTGEVVARLESEVGFERGGKLVQVLVNEGDRVNQGAELAKLDTTNLTAQLRSLIAQKAQATARLTELKNGARKEQIAAAEARVRDLEKQLKLEQLKRDRRDYLYQEGAISAEQLDEVAFNSKALAERIASAKSNLAELINGTRYEQIAAQQAVVEQLSAQIADLEITIAKSTLKSPFSGIIAVRHLDEGTVAENGQAIFRLVSESQPEVRIGVPINVAAQLSSGSRQVVKIGGKTYQAHVKSVLPEVDPATRTRTVVLRLDSTAKVSPQEIARLPITQTIATAGYWLPVTALVKGERGLWSCYAVVASNSNEANTYQIERRLVEVLETNGEQVLVKGTLRDGEAIVTEGTQRLVPGQLVRHHG